VLRRRLRRSDVSRFFAELEPCLIGIEACGSGHHRARERRRFGHDIRLMPPQYVRPYVKTNKHDAADARRSARRCSGPTAFRADQGGGATSSADPASRASFSSGSARCWRMRLAHAAEFGRIVPQGIQRLPELRAMIAPADPDVLLELAKSVLLRLIDQIDAVNARGLARERKLIEWHRTNAASQRLTTIPGIGPITATAIAAIAATVCDAARFSAARQFAAWIGFVPGQHSSGGRERMGGLSQRGDSYLRRLLVHGGTGGYPMAAPGECTISAMACRTARRTARTSARERRRRGARQQQGPHRLGIADQGRNTYANKTGSFGRRMISG
jgi:transposase